MEWLEPRYCLSTATLNGTLSGTISGNIYWAIYFSGSISGDITGAFTGLGEYVDDTKTGTGGTFSASGGNIDFYTSPGNTYSQTFGDGDNFSGSFAFTGTANDNGSVTGSGTFSGTEDSDFNVTSGTFSGSISDEGYLLIAVNQSYQIMENQTLTVSSASRGLLNGDSDPNGGTPTITANSSPSNGTVSVNTTNGTFTYTPATGYVGADSFTYTIANPFGTASATVSINVASNPTITVTQSSPPAPILTTPAAQTNTEGDTVSLEQSSSSCSGGA